MLKPKELDIHDHFHQLIDIILIKHDDRLGYSFVEINYAIGRKIVTPANFFLFLILYMKPFGLDKCFHIIMNTKYWCLTVIQHMFLELSKTCYISYVKTSCGTVGHEILSKKWKLLLYKLEILKKWQYLKNSIMTDYLFVWNRTWWGNFCAFRVCASEMQRVSTSDLGGRFRWELLIYIKYTLKHSE